MSGFGWQPGQPPQYPGGPFPPYQPGAPPPYQGTYYYPLGGQPVVHDPMNAARYAPAHSHSAVHSDSSDDEYGSKKTFYWKKSSVDEPIPINAVVAGRDLDGSVIFVGKAKHNRDKLPAKIIPQRKYAAVSYGGKEHQVKKYKVLCEHTLKWVKSRNGHVPEGAVLGGVTENGEKLYVGRANMKGALTVGKVHRSHGCLYIPFGGEEHPFKEYEVLVQT